MGKKIEVLIFSAGEAPSPPITGVTGKGKVHLTQARTTAQFEDGLRRSPRAALILDTEDAPVERLVDLAREAGVAAIVAPAATAGATLNALITGPENELRSERDEQLRLSEHRFRMVARATNDGVYDWNILTNDLWWSDSFFTLFGYSPDDVSTARLEWWEAKLHPDDRERLSRSLTQAVESDRMVWSDEYRFQRSDGSYAIVKDRGTILRDSTGRATHMIGTMMDITEQRVAEMAVRDREEQLRLLHEYGLDVLFVLDARGVIRYHSASAERVLGFAANELVGSSFLDLIHPDDQDEPKAILERYRNKIYDAHTVRTRVRHRDGSYRDFESVAANLVGHPSIQGIVITSRDITERRRMERQMEQAERLASLGRLAASVAHEFNNVLMGIQPFAEILRKRIPEDALLTHATRQIERSIERGKKISQEILRFTQPAELMLAPLEIHSWLREISAELRALLGRQREMEIIAPETPVWIQADAAQLTQVLINLVLNSREATKPGGLVSISVAPGSAGDFYSFGYVENPQNFVHLVVRDTGSGIEPANVGRIFEPLFTTRKSGTGLGLAVAHQILRRHDGHIFAESELGKGTAIHLFIPRAEIPVSAAETGGLQPGAPAPPRKILLIEDDELVADGIRMLLESLGEMVTVTHDGMSGIREVERSRPDVVVLDIGLPDLDGLEVFERLTGIAPGLPVVFSTGHGDRGRLEELLVRPEVDFLHKPYEIDKLIAKIEQVVNAAAPSQLRTSE